MKPASFEYIRPANVSEALQYLQELGSDAKIISGGQSLIPILNMRLSTPKYLIDLGRIKELNYIKREEDVLVIGAITRHSEIEQSPLIKAICPILNEALSYVAHPAIRNRGTIGGSIAHADPSAELPCIISALRGEIVIASADEEFIVSPSEFFLTYLLTSLEPHQIVKELRFPVLSPTSGSAFVEISRRHGDFALVEVAAVIDCDEDGNISFALLAVGGAGPTICVLEEVEQFLIGQPPSDNCFAEAAEQAKEYLEPEDDLHGSAEYRRELAGVMIERALKKAWGRMGGGAVN